MSNEVDEKKTTPNKRTLIAALVEVRNVLLLFVALQYIHALKM
jgi:7-cyano-7-deazaguanine synthase in queuosine biosynthesis